MHSNETRYFGIMACESEGFPPFGERQFYRHLCKLGRSLGMETFVFSPHQVDPDTKTVTAYTYLSEQGGWQKKVYPLPQLIYDRSFPSRKGRYGSHRLAVRRMLALQPVRFLGHGLKGKWEVHRALHRDPELRPYLPKTERLQGRNQLLRWLRDRGQAFLKPVNGSHGKGTLHISRRDSGYRIQARTATNRPLEVSFASARPLLLWVSRFIGRRSYLIQQYLELTGSEGGVFDIRSLVQKNGRGLWELTGMAVRKGGSGSITSNLHGGGTAEAIKPFLEREYGSEKALSIESSLRFLSEKIPPALEAVNGRMAELGLDLGVDRDGKVWVIEVNSKPGRSVFHRLCEKKAEWSSVRNPVAYANHLLRRSRADRPQPVLKQVRQNL